MEFHVVVALHLSLSGNEDVALQVLESVLARDPAHEEAKRLYEALEEKARRNGPPAVRSDSRAPRHPGPFSWEIGRGGQTGNPWLADRNGGGQRRLSSLGMRRYGDRREDCDRAG